jgi:hypothetical protein
MLKRVFLILFTAALPGMAFSVPIVSMSSFNVSLGAQSNIKLEDGSYLRDTDFSYVSVPSNAGASTSRYVNIDGDPVGFFADANFMGSSSYMSLMTGAEINWDDAYNPSLPDAQLDGSSVRGIATLASRFTVSEGVNFTGQVVNYAGNQNNSFGAIVLFDTTFGFKNILNVWDNASDSFVRESVFLQPKHTYALYAASMNGTGDDEEIYSEFWFDDDALIAFNMPSLRTPQASMLFGEQMSSPLPSSQTEWLMGMPAIATPNPPALLLFVIGLVLLGAIKLEFKPSRSAVSN